MHTYMHTYIQGSFQRKESDFKGPLTVYAGQQRVSIYVCTHLRVRLCVCV